MSKSNIAKKNISEALMSLLQTKPLKDITIQDLADKSGYTRVTYYRHFTSLYEVIEYYLDCYADDYLAQNPMDFDSLPPRVFYTRFFEHFLEPKAKEIVNILKKQNLLNLLKKNFDKYMLIGGKTGYGYLFFSGGLFNVYISWVNKGYPESPAELADYFIHFFSMLNDNEVNPSLF